MSRTVKIGTRGSQLALVQAHMVEGWIKAAAPDVQVELVIIKTTGDRFVDRPLSTLGGKGVFVKEIEDALVANQVDCAVHSMKDVPTDLAPGLIIASIPERADVRDALIARDGLNLAQLPTGASVGTSSLRRMALLRAARADLEIVPLRGNVDTRLRKLDNGEFAAITLAAAGLQRLGIKRPDICPLPTSDFLPAIGQGALAIETRPDWVGELVRAFNHEPTRLAVIAERAFLARVGGSCRTPLAAHATIDGDAVTIDALIASMDGTRIVRETRRGPAASGNELAVALADKLLADGGRAILDELEAHGG